MTGRGPVEATARGGMVHIVVDVRTARDLAEIASAAYSNSTELEATRRGWPADVAALMGAAAVADYQLGRAPQAVMVPFLPRTRPVLTLVDGGESA